jgi:two-component system, sensor histidine kinase and response regulator
MDAPSVLYKGDLLIVDDTPDNLRLLSSTLTQRGYKVRSVINGAMALMGAQAACPDLIMLDIKMPDMDGYEVCQHLKADLRTRDIPVIFISALDEVVDKVKAFTSGGVDYIQKPFQVEEVLARIENQLTIRRLQTQFQTQQAELQQALDQERALKQKIEEMATLEERNRIAREIHDTLAQALTGIIIHLEAASLKLETDMESAQALIKTGRDLARSGLAEARRSVEALRPLILETCDLYSSLQKFAEQMFSCTESQVVCNRLGHPYPLESSVENNVFRIGQEVLHNALKHAQASEIHVELVYERSHFILKITDNGQGFVANHNVVRGFGLLGMTERAERMGANLTIQSVLNQGTTIVLSVDRRNA